MELLIFISALVRTNFSLHNGVFPSGVRYLCRYVFSQVSLSRDDVVFAVLEVPVSLQFYFLARGELSSGRDG